MSLFGTYTGQQFLSLTLKPREWLVENLIRETDAVILVGNEKSGKSLFIFQLICSLTTCSSFINTFTVPKPVRVSYIQLEGELGDSQDRFNRMIKTQSFNPDLFQLLFLPPINLEERGDVHNICELITKFHTPELVIIDPVYFAFAGRLSDDEVIRKFIGNLRVMKDMLNCAIILVHHTHKQRWDNNGGVINEGDEAMFGSKFLKAWADHTLLFHYDKQTGLRTLSCNTQRSGDILETCKLNLIQPDPLYFAIAEDDNTILTLLKEYAPRSLSCEEIMTTLNIKKSTFYYIIKKLTTDGVIVKVEDKPVKYKYYEPEPTLL